ncbi:hypothetical protein, partial [Sphingomonas sp.]|uniref:hypothetical protein n=1 Tax=Sphingomonas sp. TaxID=28214 RepID=UPI002600638D
HTLIETGAFTTEQAVAAVSTALELKRELADTVGESRVRMEASLRLLRGISNSLASDLAGSIPSARKSTAVSQVMFRKIDLD